MTAPTTIEQIERIVVVEPALEVIRVVDTSIHAWVPVVENYTWTYQGLLGRYDGTTRQTIELDMRWLTIRINVDRPPAGSDLILDIKADGVSIFVPGMLPVVSPGQWSVLVDHASLFSPIVAAGAELTCDVVQIGSVFPGADLTMTGRLESIPAVVTP